MQFSPAGAATEQAAKKKSKKANLARDRKLAKDFYAVVAQSVKRTAMDQSFPKRVWQLLQAPAALALLRELKLPESWRRPGSDIRGSAT